MDTPIEGKTFGPVPDVPALQQGVLTLPAIATATMANIAPAMSFYFGFAGIVAVAGIGGPFIIFLAVIAIALLGNTLSQFTKSIPSTGSFITFIGKGFGPFMAIATAIVIGIGYILAMASVIDISGGWTQIILQHYFKWNVPWQPITLVLTLIVFYLMVRGVQLSTSWAGIFFALEIAVLVIVSVAVLINNAGHLTLAPFNPGRITGGIGALGSAFPLAIYLFIGWENSAALAEETNDPRTNVPKAVYLSIALMGASYLLFAYATAVSYHYNSAAITGSSVPYGVPFLGAAQAVGSVLLLLTFLAGFTSTMGAMIAGSNSQARLIFNSAREGLLPSALARVTSDSRTPWASFVVFLGVGLAVTYIFGWTVSPVVFFGDIATLGTILVILTYLVTNLALPVYYRRYHPDQFNPLTHLILPLLGAAVILVPLWGLVQPNQPTPFNYFPWIALGIIVVSVIYAAILNRRDPTLGERVGSIVADREIQAPAPAATPVR